MSMADRSFSADLKRMPLDLPSPPRRLKVLPELYMSYSVAPKNKMQPQVPDIAAGIRLSAVWSKTSFWLDDSGNSVSNSKEWDFTVSNEPRTDNKPELGGLILQLTFNDI